MAQPDVDPRITKLVLYAWVGEDELTTGPDAEVGLKQALTPVGMVPLAGTDLKKISQPMITEGLQDQVKVFGKPIRLVRFVFDGVEQELLP